MCYLKKMCRRFIVENLHNLSLRGPNGCGNLLRYKQYWGLHTEKKPSLRLRLLRFAPKEIDGSCCGRIEIAAVAALLRNDIRGLFSFLCILRIRFGARNDTLRPNVFNRARLRPLIHPGLL